MSSRQPRPSQGGPGIVCVGLGPGDPELMSVKADRLVRGARQVAFFRKKGRPGKARQLVDGLLAQGAAEHAMEYPVTTELPVDSPAYVDLLARFYDDWCLRLEALAQTGQELDILVDNGCTVLDVIVEHPVYGQLTGQLQISSRYDVEQFLARIRDSDAAPLSMLTGGLHLHTLCCPNEDAYTRACAALKAAGLLLGD